ncbi:50S ribosomal protein L4 [Patescibacteria group bacterium]|nr:50S ribosomal protein L4 [Patescibacteria group bacterium]MBU1663496.1 50S ribosomal protein L4 [Patescibacteria group bacterium]MBU1933686.1 50S ribosomal protein L4 [Patescibacteria group bacterium]MBU2007706.1 50S ribosomal protein L4 [Patescibacteria group bacterium]MBU2233304.1 50S ribosomal protein L4 [Patescibacteria group bacterium]
MQINIYNQNAERVGDLKLSDKVFGVKVNNDLVHQATVTQMANQRQVIAHTKDRSEVRGGGRKPWRQKGTGRARHGSSRSPIWIGGGVTFGPRNDRNFKKRINKKMKQNAIFMVLSDKVANNHFAVLDKFEIIEFKTKFFNQIISGFESKIFVPADDGQKSLSTQTDEKAIKTQVKKKINKRSFLIIVDKIDKKLNYSAKNLVGVELINLDNINIVDLLKYKDLIFTKAAVEKIEERYQ